ncbi:dimethyladenosine transferase 1, mitochondrial-like isoform X1 [Amphibalanus amphitrite]|uniref:dimethyladenosine transferase 1, mitochondrial-like isoform X1 n=1 Tax=Amphibalanus amphitrite TaxID=1232801 RepID=UPI001C9257CA|nr:dimethyladenosine transferase 1, mitochondrial-like isoform X1 [Amphibalanus amphitrite]XP_043199820.1 dimethyladenosine transferase 1, mitochondrial-like isoform X1 [Amphibalanus amphitrite]XP_043199821.1 dimethyladenosine transferase 1, mitochondrial-like isoform X1 [Amphibalanus amphitrite]XP_043199822.1 dimethyladenosine transferase 1, mitochondrial-like isoform X1 [Amphibalanus amphitrite]XP_043199824.1 dimethyladenosine transferase 1, mitochondrial-like isoform X1 [Amphibalanus amphitr
MATPRLPPLPSIRDLLRLYRLRAVQQLSQNFLLDAGVCARLARAAGPLRDAHVCEVGPGPGSVTRAILTQRPAGVTLVEKDTRFLPALLMLREAAQPCPVRIVAGDVLLYDMEAAFPVSPTPWEEPCTSAYILGNLPFSISTPLVVRWLRDVSKRQGAWKHGRVRMALTFQKEVAERLAAEAGGEQRCRLSVVAQAFCQVQHRFTLGGHVFTPRPDVDVGVVVLTPLREPRVDVPFETLEKVARGLFNMRQKSILRGTQTLYPEPVRRQLAADTLRLAELDPACRPFQLTVEEVGRLCRAYLDICSVHPQLAPYEYRVHGKHGGLDLAQGVSL